VRFFDIIFSEIRENKKDVKIVFTGDTAQLPPVNEKNSIIFSKHTDNFPFDIYLSCFGFTQEFIENGKKNGNVFNDIKITQLKTKYDILMAEIIAMDHYTMSQVVRSKSSNVLGICNTIRNWTLNFSKDKNFKKFVDGVDCQVFMHQQGSEKLESKWFKNFLKDCENEKDSIILTWTNKQCDKYNNEARNIIFKDNKTIKRFEIGDILILGGYYNIKDDKVATSNKFYTSEQIKIIQIEMIEKQIDKFPDSINKKAQVLENAKSYDQYYKKTIEAINEQTTSTIKCWKLMVKRISSKSDDLSTLYVIDDQEKNLYTSNCEKVVTLIKKLRGILATKYKAKMQFIENHIIKQLWKDYHKLYVQPFANVNYGYSITCHKGQGSTFYNVYVDMNDIIKNANENEMKRCLYTAISRTSNKLYLLI
jgi:hypothetical protein